MSLFAPSLPGPAPDVSGSLRNRGSISAMSQVGEQFNALSRLGEQVKDSAVRELRIRRAKADEWQRRQDAFSLRMAAFQVERRGEEFEALQEQRTDLSKFNKDKVIGYDSAVTDYEKYLDDSTLAAAEQVPPEWSDMWMAEQEAKNEQRLAIFDARMKGLQTEHTTQQARASVKAAAYGDAEKGVAQNPKLALELARTHREVVPAKQQQAFWNDALDDITFALINSKAMTVDKSGKRTSVAKAWLQEARPEFDQERWHELDYYADRQIEKDKNDNDFVGMKQSKQLRMDALALIDAGDPAAAEFIQSAKALGSSGDKDVNQKRLADWNANRNLRVKTDYSDKMNLWGTALSQIGVPDPSAFLMATAEARYGKKGKLSQDDYEQIKGVLGKGYEVHEADALKIGYDTIKSQSTLGYGMVGGMMAGPSRVISDAKDQDAQMQAFVSWYDSKKKGNVIPSSQECYVRAKELSIPKTPSPADAEGFGSGAFAAAKIMQEQQAGGQGPTQDDESEIAAFIGDLNDEEQAFARKKIKSMGLQAFKERYAR